MEVVLADTGALSFIIRDHVRRAPYIAFLAGRTLAISFQTVAEVLSAEYEGRRRVTLEAALRWSLVIPHSDETSARYARMANTRRALRRSRAIGSDAGDADVWIIATAMQYRIPLMCHDKQQIALGRSAGIQVFTALPAYSTGNPL